MTPTLSYGAQPADRAQMTAISPVLTSDNDTVPGPSAGSEFELLPHPRASRLALQELVRQAEDYASKARSANTVRAYQADWRGFTAFCTEHALCPLPAAPETIVLYLTDGAARYRTSTLGRRLSAIAVRHRIAGLPNPVHDERVRVVWAGIRRTLGTSERGKSPLLVGDLRAVLAALPDNLLGRRDACLLLLGWSAALRRSELVGLDFEDISVVRQGLILTLRKSKTDQEGVGRHVGVPYGSQELTCPVNAYRCWVRTAGITRGPLFRPVDRWGNIGGARLSGQAVAAVVKRSVVRVGWDPSEVAGHTLRRGLITAAAAAGVSEAAISRTTGHRSERVLRKYISFASLFDQNPARQAGL